MSEPSTLNESALRLEPEKLPAKPTYPYIIPPIPAVDNEKTHMVTLYFRPGTDKVRDNLRLRQAYGILISYPGSDRFAFLVVERGLSYRIEFPNYTTGLCPELVSRLSAIVGAENVRVEPLTFQ